MKRLIILALAVVLAAAMFLTRPQKDDFERYVRETTDVVDGKLTGGQTLREKFGEQLKTFSADSINQTAADYYLSQCTYKNYFLWTNVERGGETVYTGAVGHWFKRGE